MITVLWTCRSLNVPLPNKETLSRHSFLGPNGLRGQWLGPSAEIKVKLKCGFVILSDHELSISDIILVATMEF
jgi:STAM-binding protein